MRLSFVLGSIYVVTFCMFVSTPWKEAAVLGLVMSGFALLWRFSAWEEKL